VSDTWDAEDRAIARALDAAPERETHGADERDVDAYREVLGHLPSPAVTPSAELEDRIVAAALRRRAATVPALDGAHARRTHRFRVAALATAAVAAVVVVGLIVGTNGSGSPRPGGHVSLAAASNADVEAVLRAPGTRTAEFTAPPARVAIGRNGDGAVFDLTAGDAVGIGLVGDAGTTVIGPARPTAGVIAFVVDHPERVTAVTLVRDGVEIARTNLTPS